MNESNRTQTVTAGLEEGRGFAVVAGDRNFAEQSSKAATEITVLVNKFQSQTRQTVMEMDAGAEEAAASTEITQENGGRQKRLLSDCE